MNWVLLYEILYIIILIVVCLKIINDTRSTTKTLAYLLFAVFVPIAGMAFYFFFGINYRNRKIYSKKLVENEDLALKLRKKIFQYSRQTLAESDPSMQANKELALMLLKESLSPLTSHNQVTILVNGEEKFPNLVAALKAAKNHIHLEYYIYENDETGNEIADVLIEKAREGVEVRFLYDDFGSRSIRRNIVLRLRQNGVKAFPFFKISFMTLANRINYRNHRKIVVIDGQTAFVGGINVSGKYVNNPRTPNKLFWRDTHLRIDGPGVQYLQYLFFCDWNFSAGKTLHPAENFFPQIQEQDLAGDKVVQIAASGPDSATPTILYSLLQAINLATNEILITTPYFIPGESLIDALIISSLSGIKVKVLVPDKGDSILVNSAARSYYDDLVRNGVEVYLYQKGFVHAKTMVCDRKIAIVGTANMDFRSFDLNFEVNAVVYDTETSGKLSDIFYADIEHAIKIDPTSWSRRSNIKQLWQKTARLVSPLL